MSHEDTCSALGILIAANVPVILWGPPGQGKTSVIQQLAEDMNLHLEEIIAAIREPTDFNGLPIVAPATPGVKPSVVLAAPAWAQNLAAHDDSICFLDEISTAPPATQAGLLRFVLDRVCGELQMPEGMRVVAAANPPDIAADGWDLAPPMANRFCHLDWSLSADVVREGFSIGWKKVDVPKPDAALVEKIHNETRIILGSFLGSKPELVTVMPSNAEESGRAFPTPRTWEMAAWLYSVAKAAGANTNVVQLLLTGSVGVGAGAEFLNYLSKLDLPDPEKLLADPTNAKIPSDRPDKVYAIAASVWNATENKLTKERWVACGEVLAVIAKAGHADIAYISGQWWVQGRPEGALPSKSIIENLMPILSELKLVK